MKRSMLNKSTSRGTVRRAKRFRRPWRRRDRTLSRAIQVPAHTFCARKCAGHASTYSVTAVSPCQSDSLSPQVTQTGGWPLNTVMHACDAHGRKPILSFMGGLCAPG